MQRHGEGQAPPTRERSVGWGLLQGPAHGSTWPGLSRTERCPSVLAWTEEYSCVSARPWGCPSVRGLGCQAARSKWVLGVCVFVRSGCVGARSPSLRGVCLWLEGSISPGCRSVLGTWVLLKLPPSPVCSSWIQGCSELDPELVARGAGAGAAPALATPDAGCIRRQVAPTAWGAIRAVPRLRPAPPGRSA